MALTPLPSSIGRGSNPRPSDREPRTTTTRPQLLLSESIFKCEQKDSQKLTVDLFKSYSNR